jgi:hypothetical protein
MLSPHYLEIGDLEVKPDVLAVLRDDTLDQKVITTKEASI